MSGFSQFRAVASIPKQGPVIWATDVLGATDRGDQGFGVAFSVTDPVSGEIVKMDLMLDAVSTAKLRNALLGR